VKAVNGVEAELLVTADRGIGVGWRTRWGVVVGKIGENDLMIDWEWSDVGRIIDKSVSTQSTFDYSFHPDPGNALFLDI